MIYAFAAVLAALLLTLSVIDIRHYRLPNVLTFPLIGLGLIYSYLLADPIAGLIGAAAGYAIFVAVEIGFKRLRGIDGLGRGDAKLLAAGGAWCGWMAIPYIVLIGSLGGIAFVVLLMISRRENIAQTAIPFGPFLALAIALVWGAGVFYSL